MKPTRLTIRSYQVGFGDCFLLTFDYPKQQGVNEGRRHVLIDCGSTAPPIAFDKAKKTFSLVPITEHIAQHCGSDPLAIVATHRHKDHISGFATTANGKGPGDILRALRPKLVVQPWTEDPKLPVDATGPAAKPSDSAFHALSLMGMQSFSKSMLDELVSLAPALSEKTRKQLEFLGDDNLANLPAVTNLIEMGKKSKAEYLSYGASTDLAEFLGVKVKVLGPPTLEQSSEISKQRQKDQDEFWQLRGFAGGGSGKPSGRSPFKIKYHVAPNAPLTEEARWIIPRVRASRGAVLLQLVRALDKAMNNTSLILLFEAGGKRFLFPGDAQIENWNYALKEAPDHKANQKILAKTDFYKVGHHGSLNATPKTLWGLFSKKGKKNPGLCTMVSTRKGKHGDVDRKTEVPRTTLQNELIAGSKFFSTEMLGGVKVAFHDETFDL